MERRKLEVKKNRVWLIAVLMIALMVLFLSGCGDVEVANEGGSYVVHSQIFEKIKSTDMSFTFYWEKVTGIMWVKYDGCNLVEMHDVDGLPLLYSNWLERGGGK